MKVRYKREMRHNYLILEAFENDMESFEIRMLAGNSIEGLLKFRIKQEEQNQYYYYEITSKQPLNRLLEFKEIQKEDLSRLIIGIGSALHRMEEFLLQESNVLLEPEYIYIEPETYQVWLCYVPGYQGDFPGSMEKLLQYLLKKADHRDNDTVVLAYRLYQESQKDYYGIEDLLKAIQESQCSIYQNDSKQGCESGECGESEPEADQSQERLNTRRNVADRLIGAEQEEYETRENAREAKRKIKREEGQARGEQRRGKQNKEKQGKEKQSKEKRSKEKQVEKRPAREWEQVEKWDSGPEETETELSEKWEGENGRKIPSRSGERYEKEPMEQNQKKRKLQHEMFQNRSRKSGKTGDLSGKIREEGLKNGRRGTRFAGLFVLLFIVSVPAVLWLLFGEIGLKLYGKWIVAADVGVVISFLIFLQGKRQRYGRSERRERKAAADWYMTFDEDEPEEVSGRKYNEEEIGDESGMRPGGSFNVEDGMEIEKERSKEAAPGAQKQRTEGGANTVLLASAGTLAGQSHLLKSLDPSVEDIPIPYFPFLIGKQEGIVDYVLGKGTVSRLHVRIDEEKGNCQVTDLNSSNGTTVGGHNLEANESHLICSGDKLQIADIPFIFY